MNKKVTSKIQAHPKRVFMWVQWGLLIVALIAYAYCIMNSVVQIVLREELNVSIHEAETRIGELESLYFERSNALSRETAEAYGLVAVSPSAYVEVESLNERLTRKD